MHPDKVAVVDALTNTTHTYGELQAAALAVADALACVPPGFVVAVALPRGFELVASLLGVMLAGCVWVYLDPSYPGKCNMPQMNLQTNLASSCFLLQCNSVSQSHRAIW